MSKINLLVAGQVVAIVLAFGTPRELEAESPPAAATAAATDAPASPSDPRTITYQQWQTNEPGDYLGFNQRATLQQRGKPVYDKYCVGCHGINGDGHGPAAVRLKTKPRDFTKGVYKFRSTDSSSLPLETDLHRTITRGLGGNVSMPAFPFMPEHDKLAVIEYIKAFYPKWEAKKNDRVVMPLPVPPSDLMSAARAKRGRVVFVAMQCWTCHGADGRGAGTDSEFTDVWGNPQRAFDFTRGSLKGGDAPDDIYRTFTTGLQSIMPAFPAVSLASVTAETFRQQTKVLAVGEVEALEPQLQQFPADTAAAAALPPSENDEIAQRNSWDLVAYVMSLRQPNRTAEAVLGTPTR